MPLVGRTMNCSTALACRIDADWDVYPTWTLAMLPRVLVHAHLHASVNADVSGCGNEMVCASVSVHGSAMVCASVTAYESVMEHESVMEYESASGSGRVHGCDHGFDHHVCAVRRDCDCALD